MALKETSGGQYGTWEKCETTFLKVHSVVLWKRFESQEKDLHSSLMSFLCLNKLNRQTLVVFKAELTNWP